jgi:hypothetical protein
MERLKSMKEELINSACYQIENELSSVDTKELGEVIDMIKDLEEAMYYCTVTEAMKKGSSTKHHYEQPATTMCCTCEDCSCQKRHDYLEAKEIHQTKEKQMHEFEEYLQELSGELSEVIEKANTEEKQLLHQTMSAWISKIKG